jgi:hypothetical protein
MSSFNVGDSCALIIEAERRLGSVPIPGWPKGATGESHAYNTRAFSRNVTVSYQCLGGKLFGGMYMLPLEEPSIAVRSLHEIYNQLLVLHGTPLLDNTPWQVQDGPATPITVPADSNRYLVDWNTDSASVALRTVPFAADASQKRRVQILVMPGLAFMNQLKARRDNSAP